MAVAETLGEGSSMGNKTNEEQVEEGGSMDIEGNSVRLEEQSRGNNLTACNPE